MKRSFETKFKSNWHCVVGKLRFHLKPMQAETLGLMSLMKLADTSISILDRRASSFGLHLHEHVVYRISRDIKLIKVVLSIRG